MKQKFLILALGFAGIIFLSGCLDGEGGSSICQPWEGHNLCGYCSEDAMLSDNPSAGKCRYCPTGSVCAFDNICGTLQCIPQGTSGNGGTSGGGGSSTTYYASCSGCSGPYSTYSYRGASYATCNAYYQACVIADCSKILDNCR